VKLECSLTHARGLYLGGNWQLEMADLREKHVLQLEQKDAEFEKAKEEMIKMRVVSTFSSLMQLVL